MTLAGFERARGAGGEGRLAVLRDAAEAVAEHVRRTPVARATHVPIDRVLAETRRVLPDARLVSPFVVLARRALLLVAQNGLRVLVDPCDPGPGTPDAERLASRHPILARTLAPRRASDPRWPVADLVVSTALAGRAIVRTREQLAGARWLAYADELAAARRPDPIDEARYARRTPDGLEAIEGAIELAPGIVLLPTPGPTRGHGSLVFAFEGRVHVHTQAGVAVDAWSPYESSIPGLREAVRVRNVEALVRGDASDPARALEAMAIERALADRRRDAPALFSILPAASAEVTWIAPRLRPHPAETLAGV